jgi:hypothetical protein
MNEPMWDQYGGEMAFGKPVTIQITLNPYGSSAKREGG